MQGVLEILWAMMAGSFLSASPVAAQLRPLSVADYDLEDPAMRRGPSSCRIGNVYVSTDQDLNIRTMTIGDAGAHLVQSLVHCHGKAAESCAGMGKGPQFSFLQKRQHSATGNPCDLSSCPCAFEMQQLPPLYFEYQIMAQEVLDVETAGGGKVFLIGLGGAMLPQYVLGQSQNITFDAAEINGDVVQAARAFFGVGEAEATGRLKVTTADGLAALSAAPPHSYDRIVVDCCDGDHVPLPCRSSALVSAIQKALTPRGVVVQNVPVGGGHTGDLEPTLQEYRRVFGKDAVSVALEGKNNGNVVVRAQIMPE